MTGLRSEGVASVRIADAATQCTSGSKVPPKDCSTSTTAIATAFDKYLAGYDSEELNKRLFDLHKRWRDENKVGFNRVDLDKLAAWLEGRAG
jgi:hypothetical protein